MKICREDPIPVDPENIVLRKENRRNNITPRFLYTKSLKTTALHSLTLKKRNYTNQRSGN